MAGRCRRYKNVWSPATGGYVRRCADFAGGGLLRGIGTPALGQTNSLTGTFGDIKGVLMTGGLAVGGAVLTEEIIKRIAARYPMEGWKYAVGEIATGLALGIAIGKLLKKPKLAAIIAVGPVVIGGLRLLGTLVNAGPFAAGGGMSGMADLGLMTVEPYQQPMISEAPPVGALQVGPGVPSWMTTQQPEVAGILGG